MARCHARKKKAMWVVSLDKAIPNDIHELVFGFAISIRNEVPEIGIRIDFVTELGSLLDLFFKGKCSLWFCEILIAVYLDRDCYRIKLLSLESQKLK